MKNKVLSLEELAAGAELARSKGKKIVATNGCFDLLHVGHVRYLSAAAKLGDLLVVGVNGDESVRGLKGPNRPVNRAEDRAEVLAGLASVALVSIFPEKRATSFLTAARPHLYVKGGDYSVDRLDPGEKEVLERLGTEIKIVPFEAGYSTSGILTKLNDQS